MATLAATDLRPRRLVIEHLSITIEGRSSGTVSETDGRFTLSAPAGATLLFSFTGYTSRSVKVGTADLEVVLTQANNSLDEVVVTSLNDHHQWK